VEQNRWWQPVVGTKQLKQREKCKRKKNHIGAVVTHHKGMQQRVIW